MLENFSYQVRFRKQIFHRFPNHLGYSISGQLVLLIFQLAWQFLGELDQPEYVGDLFYPMEDQENQMESNQSSKRHFLCTIETILAENGASLDFLHGVCHQHFVININVVYFTWLNLGFRSTWRTDGLMLPSFINRSIWRWLKFETP